MTGKADRPARARPAATAHLALPRSEHVYLRVPVKTDAAALVAAARRSRRLHRPWVYPPVTAGEFVRRTQRKRDDGTSIALLALRREDDALLGVFNLSEIIRGPLQQSFLGYYAFVPHAGQGYMREGMRLVLEFAFRSLKLHRVEVNIQPVNAASIALARASGFVKEGFSARYLKIGGRWRDHERWALNADEWRTQRRAGNRGP